MNDPKFADRSFALHLLDMKYHPQSSPNANTRRLNPLSPISPRNDTIGRTKRFPPKSPDNDVSFNISPDKYDYLIRHGLWKK